MIESYVDLAYRGVSLGRRIKLTQVRPSSGYLELPTPMPVGTQVAIATDDGVAFDATVTWIYEQVAGSDRVPGMVIAPRLAADLASAWWTARVALPDEDPARVTRTRPVTARPRPPIRSTSPAQDTLTERVPAILADLNARVTAAAGLPPTPAEEAADRPTVVMNPLDQAQLEEQTRTLDPEPVIRRTGEHDVVDDGYETMIMASVDPAAIGLDDASSDAGASSEHDASSDAAVTHELAVIGDAEAAGDGEGGGSEVGDDGAASRDAAERSNGGDDKPPARRGWFRRRSKRP